MYRENEEKNAEILHNYIQINERIFLHVLAHIIIN